MKLETFTKLQTRCLPMIDPIKEAEIIDGIAATYFIEDGFDAIDYELKKLQNTDLLCEAIRSEMDFLKRQLLVVSKRISTLIIANSVSYSAQLKNIDSIRDELFDLVETVRGIRSRIGRMKREIGVSLDIISNFQHRKFLQQLKLSLNVIRTLYETEFRIKDLIQEENFMAAITLYHEAKKAASTYIQYKCIEDLAKKLTTTIVEMESCLDNAMKSHIVIFDLDRYSALYQSFKMLNKVDCIVKKVLRFTYETIDGSTKTVIRRFCTQQISEDRLKSFENLSYEQLCEMLNPDCLIDCVRELGFVICKILTNFQQILGFHVEEDEKRIEFGNEVQFGIVVQKELCSSLYSIFKHASLKYNVLLCCQDLSALKFDEFLDIVDMTSSFKCFGRKHFGNSCGEVSFTLEKHTHLYFGRYHLERLEELRMFLENEAFALCPLPYNQFTVFDLPEFTFFKQLHELCQSRSKRRSFRVDSETNLGEQFDFDLMNGSVENPFSVRNTSGTDKDSPLTLSSVNTNEEATLDNDVLVSQQRQPILCNSALNLLRFFGRYIRMTYILRSITVQAITSVIQLFNYFFYWMCKFFSLDDEGLNLHSNRLKQQLSSIEKSMIVSDNASLLVGEPNINSCRLSSIVRLYDFNNLFALVERIIAMESLRFLAKQMDLLRPFIDSLLEDEKKLPEIDQFYSKTLDLIGTDICSSVYGCVGIKVVNYQQLVSYVSSTTWNISSLQSQHSLYVDFLMQNLDVFKWHFDEIIQMLQLSKDITNVIWDSVIWCAFRALVQGYSEAGKKCSNEGRALMQLDLQHLIDRIEKSLKIKPVPHRSYVENYIKAYYLPEVSLENWIKQHTEYTSNQLITLLNAATHVSKKTRTRIISSLDD